MNGILNSESSRLEIMQSLGDQDSLLQECVFPEINSADCQVINLYGMPCTGKSRLCKLGELDHGWILHDPKQFLREHAHVNFALDDFLRTISDVSVNVFDEAGYITNLEALLRMTEVIGGKIIVVTQPPIDEELLSAVGIKNFLSVRFEDRSLPPKCVMKNIKENR